MKPKPYEEWSKPMLILEIKRLKEAGKELVEKIQVLITRETLLDRHRDFFNSKRWDK